MWRPSLSTSSEFAASDKAPVLMLYKEKGFPLRSTASKTSLNSFITPVAEGMEAAADDEETPAIDFEEVTEAAEITAADDVVNFFIHEAKDSINGGFYHFAKLQQILTLDLKINNLENPKLSIN